MLRQWPGACLDGEHRLVIIKEADAQRAAELRHAPVRAVEEVVALCVDCLALIRQHAQHLPDIGNYQAVTAYTALLGDEVPPTHMTKMARPVRENTRTI